MFQKRHIPMLVIFFLGVNHANLQGQEAPPNTDESEILSGILGVDPSLPIDEYWDEIAEILLPSIILNLDLGETNWGLPPIPEPSESGGDIWLEYWTDILMFPSGGDGG